MKLRRKPKQKSTYYAGEVRSGKMESKKKLRRKRYMREVSKATAIESNMIKLLTIANSNNPEIHLRFWEENLKSNYPVIEIRESNFINGGLGIFATNNCIYLPKNLMYIPNFPGKPQTKPADENSEMSKYQFAVYIKNKLNYLFPSLEPDPKLPCAQFINAPMRQTQGNYSDCVDSECHQAMHVSNARLIRNYPGGFQGLKRIYPGFEILGSYSTSHRLPKVEDYNQKIKSYQKQWKKETNKALKKERDWIIEIKEQKKAQIAHWEAAAKEIKFRIIEDQSIKTVDDFEDISNDEDDEDF